MPSIPQILDLGFIVVDGLEQWKITGNLENSRLRLIKGLMDWIFGCSKPRNRSWNRWIAGRLINHRASCRCFLKEIHFELRVKNGQSQRASRYSIAATVIKTWVTYSDLGVSRGPNRQLRNDDEPMDFGVPYSRTNPYFGNELIGLNCVFGNLGVETGESPNMLGYGIYLWFLERGFRLRAESGFILRLGFCHSVQYNWGLHPATLNTAYGLCGNPATSIV